MTAQGGCPFERDMFNDFDFESPEFNERFDEVIDAFAESCPVAHSKVGHGYKVLNTYQLVKKAAQDWRTFSSAKGYMVNRPEGSSLILPEESDPPYHDAWRKVLNPFLSPDTVAGFENAIVEVADELVDDFIERGECDFVADFSAHLPGRVFFKCIMGVPERDLPALFEGIDQGTFGPIEQRAKHFKFVGDYLAEYLTMRRAEPPRGDVVDIINAGVNTPEGSPSSEEDKVAVILDLVFGGLATTTHAMTAAMAYLAENSDLRARLVAEPGLIPKAVEEFVRLFSPVIAPARYVTEDATIGEVEFKKGDWIALNFAAASRDPELVPNPSILDVDREEAAHAAFGYGPHRCIGSHLARLELRVTLERVLQRIPNFAIKAGTAPVTETSQLRSTTSLQLTFEPGDKRGQ
ncbi:cytochrome P450 [Nocardia vaccinii]|uniref:cytochrome P450 n=1 Tax=Nocardia vaccinii TaxID=1822 RepID=UPI000A4B6D54|nr:cytochrome P450 [Nocardia vaccinii]